MAGTTLVHRAGQLSGWLVVWIAALLAIAPAGPGLLPLEAGLPHAAAIHSDALSDLAALKPEERGVASAIPAACCLRHPVPTAAG